MSLQLTENFNLPSGHWGVAVSGGADSIALLRLALATPGARPHIIHIDHETRDGQSTSDAAFVQDLAEQLGLPVSIATRTDLEHTIDPAVLPTNLSARFRALRLAHFRNVVELQQLSGVLLAHHADDQAETILQRLIRGGGYTSLVGMAERTGLNGLLLVRPLLGARRLALRAYLESIGQPWRKDASNQSTDYARNRIRAVLQKSPELVPHLCSIASACAGLADWVDRSAPSLGGKFEVIRVAGLPDLLAHASLSDWLRRQGVPAEEIASTHIEVLLTMCRDAASAAKYMAPTGLVVRRRRGVMFAEHNA